MLKLMAKNEEIAVLNEHRAELAKSDKDLSKNGGKGTELVHTSDLPISSFVTNEELIAEEKALIRSEKSVERNYHGWRGWLRLWKVGRVIGMLSLYLYLDQYEIHRERHLHRKQHRLEQARRLSRTAVVGEWFYSIKLAFFHSFLLLLKWVLIGSEENKELNQEKQAIWLKEKIIGLGPTFIKMGQAMGTRADLLPLPFVKELGTLVDSVPAFPNEVAFARIEMELGKKISEVYADFDLTPVAAASLGQVYRAKLFSGEEVAVKVQRPNLAGIIKGDVEILRKIAKFAERFPALNENADWAGMLREFDETIHEEMDYVSEGRNAEIFRENFNSWTNIHVPKIHWEFVTSKVLTMEFIHGTKVVDLEGLKARSVAPEKVNRLLIRTYLKQLLEDGFFHADPHPGNLLVMPDGRLAFFDFGMVGRITPKLQAKMIDAFFHVVGKDPDGIAQDLIDLDFLKPGADPETVRPVVRRMFEFHLDLKLKDVNFKELTYDLADVMYDYPFRLPSNFTYIMRALMTLEGIGIITDPEFNFFLTAKPYAKEFMLRREGKDLRKMFVDKLLGKGETETIDWNRTWKLAKLAAKTVLKPGQ
ncbi:MAG: AarF/ABC1/UbiB kinase family protein [Acidobacteria bacterium]|nr:MAG: AarF/ABC1/UbiB kinase family protein [Acidobacteriota bacterium]REJ99262.1 MAG: AarF/ABC1/UbiB kinase family protein [Acidobacteriota bacterium]REK16017.1 MAG: AarF/ABC1/UbiB kinase family protein [Acidobacteriota bacterium]REK43698.1 MAG: AarF/ABC1/UbiB kinase family protein [Acidobacteriota bacterium]